MSPAQLFVKLRSWKGILSGLFRSRNNYRTKNSLKALKRIFLGWKIGRSQTQHNFITTRMYNDTSREGLTLLVPEIEWAKTVPGPNHVGAQRAGI
jgi:hypothetical protein